MRKNIRKLLLTLIGVVLVSCNEEKSKSDPIVEKPGETDEPIEVGKPSGERFKGIPFPTHTMSKKSLSKLTEKLDKVCEEATGKGLNKNLTCECPSNGNDKIDKIFSYQHKECITPLDVDSKSEDSFKGCKRKGFKKILDEKGKSGFLDCLLKHFKGTINSDKDGKNRSISLARFFLADENDSDLPGKFAEFLDQNLEKETLNLDFVKLWKSPQNLSNIKIFVGESSSGKFLNQRDTLNEIAYSDLYRAYPQPIKSLTEFDAFERTIYEPELEALEFVLGGAKSEDIPDRLYPNYTGTNPTLELLDIAWREHVSRDFTPTYGIAIAGDGCEDVCKMYGTSFRPGMLKKSILERVYSGGNIALENMWVFDDKMKPIGLVSFGLNRKPMFYVELNYSVQNDQLTDSITVYDRRFKKLSSKKSTLVDALSDFKNKVSKVPTVNDIEDGAGVILCEPLLPDNQEWLFKGVNELNEETLTGSLYGWQKNALGNPFQSFTGFKSNFLSIRKNAGEYSHGHEVSSLIHSKFKNVKITPAGYCFYKADNVSSIANHKSFNMPVNKQKIKVLNASVFVPGSSKRGCKQRIHESFLKIKDKIVSVIGAGNDGVESPEACPQSFKGFSSIIVSGVNGSETETPSIWYASNYGENYSDIGADYHSLGGRVGTSYSAPIVSGYAAKIANQNPYLKPQDIRLAILTTVFIPKNRLPVRTGGVLRGDRALEMAKCLHKDSEISRQTGKLDPITKAQAKRCLEVVSGFDAALAKKQLDFLETRPLIFEK